MTNWCQNYIDKKVCSVLTNFSLELRKEPFACFDIICRSIIRHNYYIIICKPLVLDFALPSVLFFRNFSAALGSRLKGSDGGFVTR